jgi:GDP-L-fucose synthase
MKKNVLITGASGYIGKNLVEQLSDKYILYTPSHNELDLLDTHAVAKYLQEHPVDILIHAALLGGSRKEEYVRGMVDTNLRIFFNIIRCKQYFKKMIFFGSGAEYDKQFPIINVKEEDFDKRVPADEYGFYKYVCAKYIAAADNITCLRIFGLYGKYEDYKLRFISNAICRNLLGLPITIAKDVYFDYLYINDFVKIVDYFINNNGKHKFYNIGTGKPINLVSIAKKINEITDTKTAITVNSKELNNEYSCDNSRLLSEMQGFIFTDFDSSLKELFTWYKDNKATIQL